MVLIDSFRFAMWSSNSSNVLERESERKSTFTNSTLKLWSVLFFYGNHLEFVRFCFRPAGSFGFWFFVFFAARIKFRQSKCAFPFVFSWPFPQSLCVCLSVSQCVNACVSEWVCKCVSVCECVSSEWVKFCFEKLIFFRLCFKNKIWIWFRTQRNTVQRTSNRSIN